MQRRNIRLVWKDTSEQLGDFFTKALAEDKYVSFRNKIMFLFPNYENE